MNYVAVYFPATVRDLDKSGFTSKQEAWAWIAENHLCSTCKEELERGYELLPEVDEDGEEIRYEIDNPSDTMCGAEWCVISEEEWKNLANPADVLESMAGKWPEEKNE